MKILIVGGGIGGLAAAGFLEKKGLDVTLIERAPEFKHIGFSISVWNNGRRLLHELGIAEEVVKDGYEVPWMELTNTEGKILGHKLELKDFTGPGEEPAVSIERSNLHDALVKNLKNTNVLLGTTIKTIKQEHHKVHVEFSDDSRHTFDLLIAADGIRSKIRDDIFGHGEASFYGWSLRFFWVPAHIPIPKGVVCLSKDKVTLAIYPTIGKCCIGIYEYNPKRIDHPPIPLSDFLPYLTKHGWTKEHIDDIEKEAREGHQYYDHLQHVALGRWYKKRIVLLGDSRHGLAPISGMSGAMAMEDAFVLADELAKVASKNIDLALENYSIRRNNRIRQVFSLSKFLEKFYFIKSPAGRALRDATVSILPESFIINKFRKVISGIL